MSFVPHTSQDIQAMLQTIGLDSIEKLFDDIPSAIRLNKPLDLPKALSEPELLQRAQSMAQKNTVYPPGSTFLGAGSNRHYIPLVVDQLISRSEFYTAYTPYQPEISQGTLQAIFEFQTLLCSLTDMEVSNASMYDGASAAAEAVLMAMRVTRRSRILVSDGLHPLYRSVIETYVRHQGAELIELALGPDGCHGPQAIQPFLDETVAAIVVQYPNFLGTIEDLRPLADMAHERKALLIGVVTEPLALGILTPPGSMGADIVAGDGQSFGIPAQFGGPYVGFLTTRQQYVRQMPGRIVGETVDIEGRRGYVLTLSTREQHIRREKATSNICSNQGLCALTASITMALLGKSGLKQLAELNLAKSEYFKSCLMGIPGLTLAFSAPTFNEFVITTADDERPLLAYMKRHRILAGVSLRQFRAEWANMLLVSVTEMNGRADIDRVIELLKAYHG